MKIEIKKGNQKYTINLKQITQLIGTNFYTKNYIIDSIIKHFSNAKYLDYEEEKIDNVLSDNNIISRKYFNTYYIKNKEDLIDNIKIGKSTLMFKYLNFLMSSYDCQNDMNQIDFILSEMYSHINKTINQNIENIRIDYNIEEIINVIAKSEIFSKDNDSLYTMSTYSLIITYLQLIKTLYDYIPNKMLIIFENIDHLASKDQYDLIINRIPNMLNSKEIFIIFTSSINNYVYISKNTLCGINVINDTIFNVPNIESIKDFITRTYPSNKTFEEDEIYIILQNMLNDVGNENTKINLQSLIYLILFNKTLSINTEKYMKLNEIDLSFIN